MNDMDDDTKRILDAPRKRTWCAGCVLLFALVVTGACSDAIRNGAPWQLDAEEDDVRDDGPAISVSAANCSSCVSVEGHGVWCWGTDIFGSTTPDTGRGAEATTVTSTPTAVGDLETVVQISGGIGHHCSVSSGGRTVCWGRNRDGELGTEADDGSPARMQSVQLPDGGAIASVDAGGFNTCVRTERGGVWCWGSDRAGQLGPAGPHELERKGESTTEPGTAKPVQIPDIDSAVDLGVGFAHACAVLEDGTIRCWGNNTSGQLGDGEGGRPSQATTSPQPVRVVGIDAARAVVAGQDHTCALIDGGRVRCWGQNYDGQLGLGAVGSDDHDLDSRSTPVDVVNLDDATALAAGRHHTCASVRGGTVRCWGNDISGQLGDGADDDRRAAPRPVRVQNLSSAVAIAGGRSHTCAATRAGAVRCWGHNLEGQLGIDETERTPTADAPVAVDQFPLE